MAEKNIKTRIIHKHDTEENWNKATNFIPKQGEIIVYDIDSSHSYERIKVGDGTTNVISLPYTQVQSDWNQNDSTAKDYIKNRPFYSGIVEDTLFDGTFDNFTEIDNGVYIYFQESSLIFEEGKTYTVVFDGTSYSCISYYIPTIGLPVLGNASIVGEPGGNNEPFLILAENGEVSISTNLTDASHTVKITVSKETIKKIDAKYLPDEIQMLPASVNENAAKIEEIRTQKVDKVEGKGLSTNDFTTELKDKLDRMEEGANKTTVDAKLSSTSENPVQNKVIYNALDKKIEEPSGNGLVRKWMSGMYDAMGVDTTMPDSPTNGSVPTTKLLKDYVGDNTSNPLKLSDADLQKSGLIAQSYQAAGSTPGTVGTTTYGIVMRDTATLDDSISGAGKVPSSYAVGEYVKGVVAYKVDKIEGKGLSTNDYTDEDKAEVAKIAEKADISNPLSLSDTDKTKGAVLIQHNYDSETQTEKYIARSIDASNLSESGLALLNIPTSLAVRNYVKNAINSAITTALNTEV